VISSFVPSSSSSSPLLKSLLWFCFFFLHAMWSLSSFVPCVKMINTKLSSHSSDFYFLFYTHNVISLILCPLCQNDQYKALKSFLRFCFFSLYTQCDLSHPLSLVSKWSIQEVPT
jgi:hypothetical protein